MRKFAVISSDTNPLYAEFLPLTGLFWKAVGYEPLYLLVGDPAVWRSPELAKIITALDCQAFALNVQPVEGFKSSTVAQVSRLAVAASSDLSEDDYLMVGDADMFPLSKSWFNDLSSAHDFHVLGSDAYGFSQPPPQFPMCYLGGSVKVWREIMCFGQGEVDEELERLLRFEKDDWCLDELLAARKILAWPRLSTSCQMIARGWSHGDANLRLDRSSWTTPRDVRSLIDCHSARPLLPNWDMIGRLADAFLPPDLLAQARAYVASLRG